MRDTDCYYSETLGILISNQGQAFEATTWNFILSPNAHKIQKPHYSYLKRYPKPEEIHVKFILEPEPWRDNTEPFQSLKSENIERLDYLLSRALEKNL